MSAKIKNYFPKKVRYMCTCIKMYRKFPIFRYMYFRSKVCNARRACPSALPLIMILIQSLATGGGHQAEVKVVKTNGLTSSSQTRYAFSRKCVCKRSRPTAFMISCCVIIRKSGSPKASHG